LQTSVTNATPKSNQMLSGHFGCGLLTFNKAPKLRFGDGIAGMLPYAEEKRE